MRIHPITGMPLEDGSGALPDDQQALVLHCAYIEQTQGEAAADAMRAKILAAEQVEQTHADREAKIAADKAEIERLEAEEAAEHPDGE